MQGCSEKGSKWKGKGVGFWILLWIEGGTGVGCRGFLEVLEAVLFEIFPELRRQKELRPSYLDCLDEEQAGKRSRDVKVANKKKQSQLFITYYTYLKYKIRRNKVKGSFCLLLCFLKDEGIMYAFRLS